MIDYIHVVIDEEWDAMSRGEASQNAWIAFDKMFHEVGKIDAQTQKQSVILREIWARINELTKHRRERLHVAESSVPVVLWGVVLMGTVLTFLCLYSLPIGRYSTFLIGITGMSIGLVLFFILAMDRPFAGKESVDDEPFVQALANMDRWDKTFGDENPPAK
jgi:hypothetical protein